RAGRAGRTPLACGRDGMCGIAGLTAEDAARVARMTAALAHRGPDGAGTFVAPGIALGHRRLAVLDPSPRGAQPMASADGRTVLVFNGEIYNFRVLRDRLVRRGHRFVTGTDTEVLLRLYEAEGPAMVTHLRGMFAFAVWDARARRLLLARDRLGIKPLYYWLHGGQLAFASEIKALLAAELAPVEVDEEALADFLGFLFVPAPRTLFAGIRVLEPAHLLVFEQGRVALQRYWSLRFHPRPDPPSVLAAEFRTRLAEAVEAHLVSDVPIGLFLSGGLDSTALLALYREATQGPIRTFTLGYREAAWSELEAARRTAAHFGTDHREILLESVAPSLVESVLWALDQPVVDLSAIPFYCLARQARREVTVALSGEGGDEVLAGYDRFRAAAIERWYRWLPDRLRRDWLPRWATRLPPSPTKKGPVNVLKRFVAGAALPAEGGAMRWQYFGHPVRDRTLFAPRLARRLAEAPFAPLARILGLAPGDDPLARDLFVDLAFTLPDSVLMKVDKLSMAHGLEVRVPFLDHEVVEFLAAVPSRLKLRGGTTKLLLRLALGDRLPAHVRAGPKQGYSLPIKHWLRGPLAGYLQATLATSPLIRAAVNREALAQLLDEHLRGRADHHHRLFGLLWLALWHRRFVEAAPPHAQEPGPACAAAR
ncbi:MAG TPA: asparagine synthase (glutamine-hydrolyzing), partial [Thermodesulfobacteriota bacterium]|nr:asparagine synthase (glutamine-hydrolyzing) [Thermodesulfobacteriota bacterium]